MTISSRISYLQDFNTKEKVRFLFDALQDYKNALEREWGATKVDQLISLTFAVLAIEDGHYYQSEHDLISFLLTPTGVSDMRKKIKEIAATDNLTGAIAYIKSGLDRISYGGVSAAMDISILYFICTGGITAGRSRLLYNLFDDYFN